jgi:hypothetical protein
LPDVRNHHVGKPFTNSGGIFRNRFLPWFASNKLATLCAIKKALRRISGEAAGTEPGVCLERKKLMQQEKIKRWKKDAS